MDVEICVHAIGSVRNKMGKSDYGNYMLFGPALSNTKVGIGSVGCKE